MPVQSCCFANLRLLFFPVVLVAVAVVAAKAPLLWSENFASMVTWRHTSVTHDCLNGRMQLEW